MHVAAVDFCSPLLIGIAVFSVSPSAAAQVDAPLASHLDAENDFGPRRTDASGTLTYDSETHHLIDLLALNIGVWAPDAANINLFEGQYRHAGEFVRLDLVIAGLVNPPGPETAEAGEFDPFAYGPHPIFGFVEIDVDEDVETGGELEFPQFRYLANAARFGGVPDVDRFDEHFAITADDLDGDIETRPYVDRQGEEFHLALLGSDVVRGVIEEEAGNGNGVFEEGEVWWITAPLFHRAHGFEPFSFAHGGSVAGEYVCTCTVQFVHEPQEDRTTISLVFPLTMAAAAEWHNQDEQDPDANATTHASVVEGLLDLRFSGELAHGGSNPNADLIVGWRVKSPEQFLKPYDWDVTAILGSSYMDFDPNIEAFLWSDIWPGAVRGDLDGDGQASAQDRLAVQQYLLDHDLDDGAADGKATLAGFPRVFTAYDLDHGGVVDEIDPLLVTPPGDADDDQDIDLVDYAQLQSCVRGDATSLESWCALSDFDADGKVDLVDLCRFDEALTGPRE